MPVRIVEHALELDGDRLCPDLGDRVPGLGDLLSGGPSRPDVLIVRAGPHHTDDELRELGRRLSTAVGELLVQDAEGSLERDVFDRGHGEARQRYSASSGPAPMHTDGMHVPGQAVPRHISLTCVHPAASGGAMHWVHLTDVLQILHERRVADDTVRALSRPYWFHTKGVDPRGADHVLRRVLETGPDGGLEIQYAREYIDMGHALPQAPRLTEEQLAALSHLDAALSDQRSWHGFTPARGDVALMDNRRLLHSRTAFVNDPTLPPRRLMRLWMRPLGA